MITFAVANVEHNPERHPKTTVAAAMKARSKRGFEAAGCNTSTLIEAPSLHAFLAAVHMAFDAHHPLVLSPDDVWLCLAQGFATHVNLHAKALRNRFVQHQGKLTLQVIRHGFVRGSPNNDWQGVFSEMSNRIAEHVGKKRDLVVANFSTTGAVERMASEVVLFDAMQRYFDYRLLTRCGIPEITLLGTVEDWVSIQRRVAVFAEFNLSPWTVALLPILDKIVESARGQVDVAFWRSFYKSNEESGGPYVTGWINTFFPYIEEQAFSTNERTPVPNPHAVDWKEQSARSFGGGPGLDKFSTGLSSVPFIWDYLGTEIPMVFMGGFVGVSQDAATGAVRPAIGWGVRKK